MKKIDTENAVDKKEEMLIDKIPKTYNITDAHWETLSKNLPKNLNILRRFIGAYRDRNITKLETPYPIDYPPWTKENTAIVYKVTGIDEAEFIQSILKIRGPDEYIDPYLKDKGVYILLNMIVRWMIINKKEQDLAVLQYYIGYSVYWSVFVRYFKVYKPKPSIMMYTITNMSYKNLLKSLGSVDKWLYNGVKSSYETYYDKLLAGADYDLYYIAEKIKAKFDGYMKNLYREQEKNSKAGNNLFISGDEVEGVKTDNASGIAEVISLSEKYTTRFFANPINESAIRGAKSQGGISERDLRNTIFLISDDSSNLDDVRSLFQSIFYIFLDDTDYSIRDIGSLRFYTEMQKLYKPGNSHDTNRLRIRDILDKWLKMGSRSYRVSNRVDTISKFRRSIYEYFILKIMDDK